MTAIEIQQAIRQRVIETLKPTDNLSADDQRVLALWGEVLRDLAADPLSTADRLDWAAKYSLLKSYRARGLEWDDPRLALIDIQYHDIDPNKGLYHALVKRGRMQTLVSDEEIQAAVENPPTTTRAWLRGTLVKHYADSILAANWDSVILDLACDNSPATRVMFPEPLALSQTAFADTSLGRFSEDDGSQNSEKPTLQEVVDAIKQVSPDLISSVG